MKLPFGWRLTLSRGPSLAPEYDVRRAILVLTKAIMDKTTALAALTLAVTNNTTAVNAAVAHIGATPPVAVDGVDPQAVMDAAAAIQANTDAINAALNPPTPAAPAADGGTSAG